MRPGFRFVAAVIAGILAVTGAVVAAEVARFAGDALERPGIDAFYEQPADAATGDPGTIVKTDPLLGAPLAARAWRIMYRTTTAAGEPVVATGVIVVPLLPAPPEGRTVVSWGHPTTGAARDCAPSYAFDPFSLIEGLRALLDRGYAVVATDYVGMGTDGPDSYLVGITGGNAVLDAVRAARPSPRRGRAIGSSCGGTRRAVRPCCSRLSRRRSTPPSCRSRRSPRRPRPRT